jgi:LuxR family maltose regulon positive regulatory protein
LIIATREDPPLPLARLRAHGELAEVRVQDLRFSAAETTRFLQEVMGLALPAEVIAALDARIEGWPAGLQLVALSLQRQDDPAAAVAALAGSHHFILNYLTEEVLRRLPADQQDFLLDTAILPRLSGPLCDALLERHDSAAQIEALYAANLFVTPLDDAHHWWRYHHLFAELLRAQLQHKQPARAAHLLRRASVWFAAQDQPAEAIELAFAAEDYAQAVALVERYARQQVQQGYVHTVEQWLQRLPATWRPAGRRANLAFAWSLLLRGQLQEVEPYLLRAESPSSPMADEVDAALRAETASAAGGTGGGARRCGARSAPGRRCTGAGASAMIHMCWARRTLRWARRTTTQATPVAAIVSYRAALPLCQAGRQHRRRHVDRQQSGDALPGARSASRRRRAVP